MFKLLLPLFSLVFVLLCFQEKTGWLFFALCPLRIKGLFFILLCVSFLGTAAGEECMLNASLLHLHCNEMGTTWTLHCRALEGWVAVASMNLSHSTLISQVFHHTKLSP